MFSWTQAKPTNQDYIDTTEKLKLPPFKRRPPNAFEPGVKKTITKEVLDMVILGTIRRGGRRWIAASVIARSTAFFWTLSWESI